MKESFMVNKVWGTIGLAAFSLSVSAAAVLSHGERHNPTRHHYMMKNQLPAEYKDQTNKLSLTEENLSNGEKLYAENCASCHGTTGKGDGEAAKDLNPPPVDLTGMYDRPMMRKGRRGPGPGGHMMQGRMRHRGGGPQAQMMGGLNLDAYSFWAISEGGEMIGSAMPAFKEVLSEEERWQVILFVANGFTAKVR
jgi:mono/diheme cytochrome c family protein